MFNAGNGLYFEKLPDGGVRILKRSGNDSESPVIFDHVLKAEEWADVVARVGDSGANESADLPPILD